MTYTIDVILGDGRRQSFNVVADTAERAITLEKLSEILETVMSDSGRLIDEFV